MPAIVPRECKLSSCLAAYMMFMFAQETYYKRRSSDYINKFKEFESKISQTIPDGHCMLKLKKLDDNYSSALNIYKNICKNSDLFLQLDSLFGHMKYQIDFIDLEKGIGLMIFESKETHCGVCKKELLPKMRNNGTKCVVYTVKDGPKPAISYQKTCSRCGGNYQYGQYKDIHKTMIRTKLDELDYFQLTPYTYIEKRVFDHLAYWLLNCCNGIEKFSKYYNLSHENIIDEIEQKLVELDQKVGKRKNTTLCNNRLHEAYFYYTLQIFLEKNLNITVQITKDEINIIKKNKEERIKVHRELQEQLGYDVGKREIDICPIDIFNFLYDKYETQINEFDDEILKYVPIKNGVVLAGHFSIMIDGNVQSVRFCCGYPEWLVRRGMIGIIYFIYMFFI